MEKKQYIMPSVRVKAVKLENQLLAGSESFIFDDDNNTGTTTPIDENAEGPALSKGYTSADVWED